MQCKDCRLYWVLCEITGACCFNPPSSDNVVRHDRPACRYFKEDFPVPPEPKPQDRHMATPQVVSQQAEMMYERASKPLPHTEPEKTPEPEVKADTIDPDDLAWFKLLLRQALEKLAPLQRFLDKIPVPDEIQEPTDEAFRLLNYILRKD